MTVPARDVLAASLPVRRAAELLRPVPRNGDALAAEVLEDRILAPAPTRHENSP